MDGKHVASSVWFAIVGWVRQESAAATALVQAFIALGIAFAWWHWNNAQTGAVIGIVSALLGMFVRSQVTPLVRPRSGRNIPLAEAGPSEAGPPQAQTRPPATQARQREAQAWPTETQAAPPADPYQGGHVTMPPTGPPTRPDVIPPGGPGTMPPAGPPDRPAGGPPPAR